MIRLLKIKKDPSIELKSFIIENFYEFCSIANSDLDFNEFNSLKFLIKNSKEEVEKMIIKDYIKFEDIFEPEEEEYITIQKSQVMNEIKIIEEKKFFVLNKKKFESLLNKKLPIVLL